MSTPRNLTEFVKTVENTLGLVPDPKYPVWRARALEVQRIKKKMEQDPTITLHNLMLAMEYCRRKKIEVKSATALCWKVKEALAEGQAEEVVTDNERVIAEAIATEQRVADDWSEYWISRFTRAVGEGRQQVLAEWSEAGRDR